MNFIDERANKMKAKLVREHIKTYVLDTIPNKERSHSELENLTLTHSKIYEIKSSFGIEENDYRNLISVLFTSDLFVNEITETLAFNYAIYTQDVIPSEKKATLEKKTTLSTTPSISSSSSTTPSIKKSKLKIVRSPYRYGRTKNKLLPSREKRQLEQRLVELFF